MFLYYIYYVLFYWYVLRSSKANFYVIHRLKILYSVLL